MPLPAQIGKYEILDLIGRGGMGVVYKARDSVLGRLVALKVMTSDLAGQSEVQIRFLREARSVAALQHPNIVVVHELGEYDGSPFIAMEYLDGEPLDRLIRNHAPLTVLEKVDIILQVAKALQYAHDKGVIHRDVKPGNIMRMGDGSVKVVDFGIAHLADQTITKTGMVLGTLAYLAPEQLNGEGIDRRTDIFSLGVVLYQLLSGKLPFEGGSTAEVMMKILLEAPPPLPPTGDVNPPELQPIIDKALAKKKEGRYQMCSELLEALVHVRRTFEVQTQLASLEEERRALLAQLDRQGVAVTLPAGQQHPAGGPAQAQATPLQQTSPVAGDSVMSPTRRDQPAQPGQPRSRHSKRLAWMVGGLSIVLVAGLVVTSTYLWRSHGQSSPVPTPQPASSTEATTTHSSPVVKPLLSSGASSTTSTPSPSPTKSQAPPPAAPSRPSPLPSGSLSTSSADNSREKASPSPLTSPSSSSRGISELPRASTNLSPSQPVISPTPGAGALTAMKGLSKEDVIKLLKGNVRPDRVKELARARGISFAVSPEVETEIRNAGATDTLVSALRDLAPKSTSAAPPPPAPPDLLIQSSPAGFQSVNPAPSQKREATNIGSENPAGLPVEFEVWHAHGYPAIHFAHGTIRVSKGGLDFREDGSHANATHTFNLSCSEVKQAKQVRGSPWFHIRFRSENYNFVAGSDPNQPDEIKTRTILQAISSACGT